MSSFSRCYSQMAVWGGDYRTSSKRLWVSPLVCLLVSTWHCCPTRSQSPLLVSVLSASCNFTPLPFFAANILTSFSGKSNLSAKACHTHWRGGGSLSQTLHGGPVQVIPRTQTQLWTSWKSQASDHLDVFFLLSTWTVLLMSVFKQAATLWVSLITLDADCIWHYMMPLHPWCCKAVETVVLSFSQPTLRICLFSVAT